MVIVYDDEIAGAPMLQWDHMTALLQLTLPCSPLLMLTAPRLRRPCLTARARAWNLFWMLSLPNVRAYISTLFTIQKRTDVRTSKISTNVRE